MLSCFFVWVLSDFHFLEKFWNFDKVKIKEIKTKIWNSDKFFQLQAYRPIHEQQMCTAKLHWGLAQPAFRSGCFAHSVNRAKVLSGITAVIYHPKYMGCCVLLPSKRGPRACATAVVKVPSPLTSPMVLFIRFVFLTQTNKLIANIADRTVSHVWNDLKEKETQQILKQTLANALDRRLLGVRLHQANKQGHKSIPRHLDEDERTWTHWTSSNLFQRKPIWQPEEIIP
jgi:hypothetical protein